MRRSSSGSATALGAGGATRREASRRDDPGRAVRVAHLDQQHILQLDEDALRRVLLHEDAGSRSAVVVAVAGALRKGKSFLLSYFLRYLAANGQVGWMGAPDDPLGGFSWRGGSEPDTSGILLWSRPYARSVRGEEMAVLLMDTQGAFDSESTVRDCSTVFALTTMVTSVFIYNLMHNIQEDDLQHLQFFIEYSRMALKDSSSGKPFQTLIFLVRDWPFPYEYPFGYEGGKQLLDKLMRVNADTAAELVSVRTGLTRAFEEIRCFLMPHPGFTVASEEKYDGRHAAMEADFKAQLRKFTESVLAPTHLRPKDIGHTPVKCCDLFEFFKLYAREFHSGDLPEPKSLYLATAEGNQLAAVAEARALYVRDMEALVAPGAPYVLLGRVRAEHAHSVQRALHAFDARPKMGGAEMAAQSRALLRAELEAALPGYVARNSSKRFLRGLLTPLLCFVAAVLLYAASAVAGVVRLHALASAAGGLASAFVLLFVAWLLFWLADVGGSLRVAMDVVSDLVWRSLVGDDLPL